MSGRRKRRAKTQSIKAKKRGWTVFRWTVHNARTVYWNKEQSAYLLKKLTGILRQSMGSKVNEEERLRGNKDI